MRIRSRPPAGGGAAAAAVAAAAVLCCPAAARAQQFPPAALESPGGLVNLDVPAVRPSGALAARLEVRAFRGEEDLVYTGLSLDYGIGGGWGAVLRGAFAERQSRALTGAGSSGAIRHGGSDVEIAARYRPGRQPADDRFAYAAQVGVSFAGTPAQDDTFLTLGAMASARIGDRGTAYLNPRAVLIDDNTLVGIGMGGFVRLSDQFALLADFTPLLSGDNTRKTTTGQPSRRDVFGFGLRFGPSATAADAADARRDRWDVEVGYTNAVGRTTGFGLTPGLGDSGAFYAAFTYAR